MKKRFVLFLWLVLLVTLAGCSSISNMSFYRDYVTNDADKQKREILLCEKPSYGLDGVAELLCTRGGAIYRYRGDDHHWYLQYNAKSEKIWLQVDRPILFDSRNRAEVVRNEQLVDLMQIRQPVRRQQSHSASTSKTPKLLQTSTAKTQPVNSQEKAAKKEAGKEQQKTSNSKLQSSRTTAVPVTAQERALMAQKKALAAQEEALQAKKQAITAHERAIDAKIKAINAQERATKAQKQALEEQERIGLLRQQKQSNNPVQPKVSATTKQKTSIAQQKAGNSFQKKSSQQPVKVSQGPVQNQKLTAPAKAQSAQKSQNTQKSKEQKPEKQATKSQKTQPVQK